MNFALVPRRLPVRRIVPFLKTYTSTFFLSDGLYIASHVIFATWVAPGTHLNFESHVCTFLIRKKNSGPSLVLTRRVEFWGMLIFRTFTVVGVTGLDTALNSLYSRRENTREVLLGFGDEIFLTGDAFSADRMRAVFFVGLAGDTDTARRLTGRGGLSMRGRVSSLTTRTLELARNFFRFAGAPLLIVYYNIIVLRRPHR